MPTLFVHVIGYDRIYFFLRLSSIPLCVCVCVYVCVCVCVCVCERVRLSLSISLWVDSHIDSVLWLLWVINGTVFIEVLTVVPGS
jgi:hypothetical protein